MSEHETHDEYQESQRGNIGMALTALFVGLGTGAVIALLFAPRTGKQMRRTLRRKYEDAREAIEDLGDQANDILDRGTHWAQTAKDAAKEKVEPIGRVMGIRR